MKRSSRTTDDTAALRAALAEREVLLAEGLAREGEILDTAMAERAERVTWWESMVTEIRRGAQTQQLASCQSMGKSLSILLGGSIRDQAKVMIPFEIAEATRELARFLGTRDPGALASSLQHAAAAKQYAAVAKASAPGGHSSSAGGSGGGGAARRAREEEEEEEEGPRRRAHVIVNVGRQVGLIDTYEFARGLIEAINENVADDVILEVAK